jgi:class 3 adenylate cyclase
VSIDPKIAYHPRVTTTDKLGDLEALFALRDEIDEALERALVERKSVADLLRDVLPRAGAALGVRAIVFRTYAEDLSLHDFTWGEAIPDADAALARAGEGRREAFVERTARGDLFGQPLDVVGTWFGALLLLADPGDEARRAYLERARGLFCEILDNYLYSIKAAREKHAVTMKLAGALRHRVLPEGLREAVAILSAAAPIGRLLLVYVSEEGAHAPLHTQLYDRGELRVDTMQSIGESPSKIRGLARAYFDGESDLLLDEFAMRGAQEEVLINGITNSVVVGRIVVTSTAGSFNTYDRELLSSFAGYIRQRIVDFNKEWRNLAASFSQDDVGRLLAHDDYDRRYLQPREAEVAILYVDIAGFTRLSEQVLKTPARVAAFVESWSRDAVDLVWQHGGVFDKMVGDCVIALFGPPFYEHAPGERLAAALRCAVAIRAMTSEVPKRPGFEDLAEGGVAVSTGVNLAPLFVGTFGPNGNFTGFSSGMNNTARLQGCATRDEILVMEDAIAALPAGHGFRFGEPRHATVKNVAEPLRFRAISSG